MKIPVNLENYPNLLKLFKEKGQQEFVGLMKGLFTMADEAARRGDLDAAKEYFHTDYVEVLKGISDAFFDMEGILSHHGEKHARELAKVYGLQIHPLHAAFTDEKLEDRDGQVIPFHQKYGTEARSFSIKTWMQGLLFWSYYCDLRDMARALSLKDLVLAEEVKKKYFLRLHSIQPALKMQENMGIALGTLIPNTGLLDTGIRAEEVDDQCPACKKEGVIYEGLHWKACRECSAGYRKKD